MSYYHGEKEICSIKYGNNEPALDELVGDFSRIRSRRENLQR